MGQSRTRMSRLPPRLTREADERPPVADPVLEIEDLRVRFHVSGAHGHDHTVRAVDGVDIAVGRRETLGVVGESGCGKSVTSLAVMRLVPSPPGSIASGSIRLQGRDLLRLDEEAMRRIRGNRISMIFQEPMTSLNPVFSIGYQVAEVLQLHRAMAKREAYAEAARLLGTVGVPDPEQRVHDYPFQLSGGIAPAGDDRHGAGVPAGGADRRRAHHRAGRDHPGTDPATHGYPQGTVRIVDHLHHPRPGGDRRIRRPGGGDVRRRGGGDGFGA